MRAVFPLGLACAMMKEIGSNGMVEDAKAGNTRYFFIRWDPIEFF